MDEILRYLYGPPSRFLIWLWVYVTFISISAIAANILTMIFVIRKGFKVSETVKTLKNISESLMEIEDELVRSRGQSQTSQEANR